MSQEIIHIYLRTLKQRLDLLVHQHCSPLEQREYFIACEMERSIMAQSFKKTEALQQFDLDDVDTQIFEKGELTPVPTLREKIVELTVQIELNPNRAEHWFQRALLWKSQKDTVAYLSDLCRAKHLAPSNQYIEDEVQNCRETLESRFFPMAEHVRAFTSGD